MPLLNLDNYVESVFQSKIFEADDGIRTPPMQKTRKLDALISAWNSHTLYKEQTVFFHLRPHFPHIWEGKLNLLAFMVFFRIRFSENFLCSIFGLFFFGIFQNVDCSSVRENPRTLQAGNEGGFSIHPSGLVPVRSHCKHLRVHVDCISRRTGSPWRSPCAVPKRGLTCASCVL